MKEITLVKDAHSTDEYQAYKAKIAITAEGARGLIALIENFPNLEGIQEGLFSFSVRNHFANVEIYEGEGLTSEVRCDASCVLVYSGSVYFTLNNHHNADTYEVGEFSKDDLENIIKSSEGRAELKAEVLETLKFFMTMDKQMFGHVRDNTKAAFTTQGYNWEDFV